MKHSNQQEAPKNQGGVTGQQKKANKSDQGGHHDPMDSRETKQNPEHKTGQGGDGSNWPKEKQGNKKK